MKDVQREKLKEGCKMTRASSERGVIRNLRLSHEKKKNPAQKKKEPD